jgi:hypothetical protein
MAIGSLYSATDKALFDALNQYQITNQQMRDFFLSRGIIISKDTPRKALAKTFSRFIHDYEDHKKLASILGISSRRERITSTVVSGDTTIENFENAAQSLKEKLSSEGEHVHIDMFEKTLRLSVKYTDYDFNKSEFKQVVEREAVVIIEQNNDDFTIRGPLNEKSTSVTDFIIESVESDIDTTLPRKEVSLINVESALKRTQFFTNLIESMDGFELVDVTDVYVFHPRLDDEDSDEGGSSNAVHISKASLKGEGVLQSEELQSLSARGFYIWKIVWVAKRESYDSDHYVFEAQFSNAEECSQFSYLAKGFLKYLGQGEYSSSKVQHSEYEEQKLNKLIEITALSTIKNLD